MNSRNELSVILDEAQPQHLSLSIYYTFGLDQDAQAEGRTAHPTDQVFVYSPTVMIVPDDVPLGIEDLTPHDTLTLADLNYTQRTVFIINDENGNINEDATSYSNNDLNIIVPVIQNDNTNPVNLIVTYESDFAGNDEGDLDDDDGQTDQANTFDGQPATTVPTPIDILEIEKGIASSIKGAG